MFDKAFPFTPEKMAELFKTADMTKMMEAMKVPGMDPSILIEAQKKNMDALMAANQAAASGYQDLFKKQVAIFEETMSEAQKQMAAFDPSKMTPEAAEAQAQLAQAAYERAIRHMTELAEAAKDANSKAFAIVSERMKDSMTELRDMAKSIKS